MEYVIILAGGVGSRFWPLSRETEPKQFLNICSDKPMLEDAVARLKPLVPRDRMFVATSARHREKVIPLARRAGIAAGNILFEPQVRNTFAPIAYLCAMIYRRDPNAVIAVIPCDHFVRNENKFRDVLRRAFTIAGRGLIVTCGFPPRRPETGYGYIKVKARRNGFCLVESFLEKPDEKTAKKFMKDKRFFWNGGVFVFSARTMSEEIKTYMPSAFGIVQRMVNGAAIQKLWRTMPNISVDYAVMERTKKAALIPADYGWLDLGSWQAVIDVMKKDRNRNISVGPCLDAGSRDILSWSEGRIVATIGLRDVIVVETADAVLVCAKDRTQDVKAIVERVKKMRGK